MTNLIFKFSGCNRGGSSDIKSAQHYICIHGLLLKYDERMGALNLDSYGFNICKQTFLTLGSHLIGGELARVEWPSEHIFQMSGCWLFSMQCRMVQCFKV